MVKILVKALLKVILVLSICYVTLYTTKARLYSLVMVERAIALN